MAQDALKLVEVLSQDNIDERRRAAEKLAQLGPAAKPAAVLLAQASSDPDETVREHVVAALEEMGPPSLDDADELMSMLAHESPDVGYWAATLLGRLGKAAQGAVPALTAALTGPSDIAVRQRAAWALGKIGHTASKALPALEEAARSDNPRHVKLAQQAMESIQRESTLRARQLISPRLSWSLPSARAVQARAHSSTAIRQIAVALIRQDG